MGIWDIMMNCRQASQIENQCKAELKRQQQFALNMNSYMNIYGDKMTREEAVRKLLNLKKDGGYKADLSAYAGDYISVLPLLDMLEALGLLKFEEVDSRHSSDKGKYIFFPNPDKHKDNVSVLQSDAIETMKKYGFEFNTKNWPTVTLNKDNFFGDHGVIKIEAWPEGLVVWVGGEIVYRSWKP